MNKQAAMKMASKKAICNQCGLEVSFGATLHWKVKGRVGRIEFLQNTIPALFDLFLREGLCPECGDWCSASGRWLTSDTRLGK